MGKIYDEIYETNMDRMGTGWCGFKKRACLNEEVEPMQQESGNRQVPEF